MTLYYSPQKFEWTKMYCYILL